MGDQDDGTGEGRQRPQDLLAAGRVEVVGGLVQEQDVGAGDHQDGQRQAGLLAAGQDARRLVGVGSGEQEGAQHAAHLGVVHAGGGAAQVLHDARRGVDGLVLLGVVADLEAVAAEDLP